MDSPTLRKKLSEARQERINRYQILQESDNEKEDDKLKESYLEESFTSEQERIKNKVERRLAKIKFQGREPPFFIDPVKYIEIVFKNGLLRMPEKTNPEEVFNHLYNKSIIQVIKYLF